MKHSQLILAAACGLVLIGSAPAHAQKEVLDITPAVLERFIAAAEKQDAERARLYATDPGTAKRWAHEVCYRGFNEKLLTATTEDARNAIYEQASAKCDQNESPELKYEQCKASFDAKIEPLKQQYYAAEKKGDKATMQRIATQGQAMEKEMDQTCGRNPRGRPMGHQQHQQQNDAEDQSAVEQKMMEFDEQAVAAAAPAGQFTDRQYAIVRERVIAYLRKSKGDDSDSVRGYKFSAAESAALAAAAPRLRKLFVNELI